VPLSAIVFGGRRRELTPLVLQARNWRMACLVGASDGLGNDRGRGRRGRVVRRDPMAMKPFCGYNFGDYWNHWLSFDQRASRCRRSSRSTGSARSATAKFLWPGFWRQPARPALDDRPLQGPRRCARNADRSLPNAADVDLAGTDVGTEAMAELLRGPMPLSGVRSSNDVGKLSREFRRAFLCRSGCRGSIGAARSIARGLEPSPPTLSHYVGEGARGSGVISPRRRSGSIGATSTPAFSMISKKVS